MSDRMRLSLWKRRPLSINLQLVLTQRDSRRWSIRPTSKLAMSVTTAASADTLPGSI